MLYFIEICTLPMICNIEHLKFIFSLSYIELRQLAYAIHVLEFELNFYPYKYYIKLTSKLEADKVFENKYAEQNTLNLR